jgi:large-conductance mechanosensitive channel
MIQYIIDFVLGYGVIIGAIFCIIYSLIHIILTPRIRYIVRSGDIVKVIEQHERKSSHE